MTYIIKFIVRDEFHGNRNSQFIPEQIQEKYGCQS